MAESKIVEKIQKLLNLAADKGATPEEAANAAARAAEMMAKHHVAEAELRAKGGGEAAEPIESEPMDADPRDAIYSEMEAWQQSPLVRGVFEAFGCTVYIGNGQRLQVVGRKSDRQTAVYVYRVMCHEIRRLSEAGYAQALHGDNPFDLDDSGEVDAEARDPAAWKAGFRKGAAVAVYERLAQQRMQLRGEQGSAAGNALTVRDSELEQWIKQNLGQMGRAHSKGSPSQGYGAGRAAGNVIPIGAGNSKAARLGA